MLNKDCLQNQIMPNEDSKYLTASTMMKTNVSYGEKNSTQSKEIFYNSNSKDLETKG